MASGKAVQVIRVELEQVCDFLAGAFRMEMTPEQREAYWITLRPYDGLSTMAKAAEYVDSPEASKRFPRAAEIRGDPDPAHVTAEKVIRIKCDRCKASLPITIRMMLSEGGRPVAHYDRRVADEHFYGHARKAAGDAVVPAEFMALMSAKLAEADAAEAKRRKGGTYDLDATPAKPQRPTLVEALSDIPEADPEPEYMPMGEP